MVAQQNQAGLRATEIAFPGTEASGTAWDLYNQMIAGIPEGVLVRDYCLGLNWSYVEADCGMGVAFTVRGGGKRTYKMDLRGMELRQVAELSKSWCFQEATLGIAALNVCFVKHFFHEKSRAVSLVIIEIFHRSSRCPGGHPGGSLPEPRGIVRKISAPPARRLALPA